MEWTKEFYAKQFLMMQASQMDEAFIQKDVERTIEQFGKPFTTVLELGAGMGYFAQKLAQFDKQITTVEYVQQLVDFAKQQREENVQILQGDFYTINLPQTFDCILYIDGFGIGEDADQLQLLSRIYEWLTDDGYALIDIYEPNYWKAALKEPMLPTGDSQVYRQYDFELETNRFLDTWWYIEAPEQKVTQSLKCYSVKEIELLCEQANLQIVGLFPGGAVDYTNWTYQEVSTLDFCISYRIKVKRK